MAAVQVPLGALSAPLHHSAQQLSQGEGNKLGARSLLQALPTALQDTEAGQQPKFHNTGAHFVCGLSKGTLKQYLCGCSCPHP